MFEKLKEILKEVPASRIREIVMEIPVVNIVPALGKVLVEVPQRFDALPEEKKQQFFESAFAAGIKAMDSYSGRSK